MCIDEEIPYYTIDAGNTSNDYVESYVYDGACEFAEVACPNIVTDFETTVLTGVIDEVVD